MLEIPGHYLSGRLYVGTKAKDVEASLL